VTHVTSAQAVQTVRDATYGVLRAHGLTTLFSNPGSTEVAFLAGLPDDLEFVLGLHEGSVVAMASGYAIGRGRPAFVLLHTTAGLGNAVSALATARVNRAPLVVVVGQQDRRHLPLQPFLAGKLEGLAGEYPVWVDQPARAQDVPGAIARAAHEAVTGRGPAIVIVPMDDWLAPADGPAELAAPGRVLRPPAVDDAAVDALASLLDEATAPALVVGAGAATDAAWEALIALAEGRGLPVFQESFGARPGFPQDHPRFAGQLPADRPRLRAALAAHDAVVAIGAPIFRQYPFAEGPLVEPGTRLAVVSDDPDEVHRSPAELAVLGDPAAISAALALRPDPSRRSSDGRLVVPPAPPALPQPGAPLRPGHVLHELAGRLPADVILVEESPSSRPELEQRLPARTPLGFVSAAMGGLGFAVPAAVGLRLACPQRPVVAIVGDGSSLYQVQALWSANRYGAGALFVVLVNGRYAIMDRLAERHGQPSAWPDFEDIDVAGVARSLGCPAQRVVSHDELTAVLDDVIPTLAARERPLLLAVEVAPDPEFHP
jgi:benzoylformate decarboxylase